MMVQIELDELNRLVEIEKKYLIIEAGLKISNEIIKDAIEDNKVNKTSNFRTRLEEAQKKQIESKQK